ncbi:MAG TPA: hypothetical protein VME41_14065 [Stellaceae bacterium]|nr:hypothetical protein [Stellaceae bacterium]
MDFPDTPEAVALALLDRILERDAPRGSNKTDERRILDLYSQCLAAVTRPAGEQPVFH